MKFDNKPYPQLIMRLSKEEKELLRKAAIKDGRTMSGFARHAAIEKAKKIIES